MIPKYCYYKPESEKRGDKFIIDRHPKLVEQGIRQWATLESKKISIQDKFKSLMDKIKELENNDLAENDLAENDAHQKNEI